MRYDFRKIQTAIDEALQRKPWEAIGHEVGVHYTTIQRALKSGRSHQSTAVKLTTWSGHSMKDIQVKPRGRVA